MSVRIVKRPSSPATIPMEMPATGALIGTPASMRLSVLAQVEAIEVDPLADSTSETTRIVYGKSFRSGNTGTIARSPRAP